MRTILTITSTTPSLDAPTSTHENTKLRCTTCGSPFGSSPIMPTPTTCWRFVWGIWDGSTKRAAAERCEQLRPGLMKRRADWNIYLDPQANRNLTEGLRKAGLVE